VLQSQWTITFSFRKLSHRICIKLQGSLSSRYIIGDIRMGFYGSSDPTNIVKALQEVVVLRISLQSHQVRLTMLQYYTYTKMNRSTLKCARWDKTQPRDLLNCSRNCATTQCYTTQHNWTQITLKLQRNYSCDARLSKVLHPTQYKTGHFGDILPSQSLGLILKKLIVLST